MHETRFDRAPRRLGKLLGFDPDRKGVDLHFAVADRVGEVAAVQPAFAREIAGEIECIVAGLEADQIVLAKRRQQPFVIGQRGEDLRRRARDVQDSARSKG